MNLNRIPRFFLQSELNIIDNEEQINQIVRVLRLKEGDQIIGIKDQKEYLLQINQIVLGKTNSIKLNLISQEQNASSKELHYHLKVLLPLLKGEKLDWVLQKCTELGVMEFQFIIFENAIKESQNWNHKIKRWKKILIESCEQSERVQIPIIKEPIKLQDIQLNAKEMGFAFIERLEQFYDHVHNTDNTINTNTSSLTQQTLTQQQSLLSQKNTNKTAIFGPEGGFSMIEKKMLLSKNFIPISLGKRILRSETAIINGIGLISFLSEN